MSHPSDPSDLPASDLPVPIAPDARMEQYSHRIRRLRRYGRVMDSAIGIPGTRFRLGLDPIIGLLPGGGDTAGLVFSSYIVLEAARMGVSKSVLSAMALNILLETLVGTVPVVGDLFDVTWKSNLRNIALLEDHLKIAHPPEQNRWFAILLIGGLALVVVGCVVLSVYVLRWLFQLVQLAQSSG